MRWTEPFVDEDFYRRHYLAALGGLDPVTHYEAEGRAAGLMPNPSYDPLVAAISFPGLPEAEAAIAIEEHGLDVCMRNLAREVFSRIEHADAFDWRYADTQVEKDHFRRPQALLAHWDSIDAEGEATFGSRGATYTIRKRSAEHWRALIASGRPCARPRLPHGFMDIMGRASAIAAIVRELWGEALGGDDRIDRLAVRILRVIFPKSPVLTENFVQEIVEHLKSGTPGLSVCLAFKAHPDYPDLLFGAADPSPLRCEAATDFIGRVFPDGHVFEDAIAWKRFASTGRIGSIIEEMRGRKVILIANRGFRELGRRWGLDDFHHVEIPPAESHLIRHELLGRLTQELSALGVGRPDQPPAIVLTQAGGSFSLWLLCHLWKSLPYAVYLDVGQAINIWFLDDPATGKPEMLWLQDYWRRIFEANGLFSFYGRLSGREDAESRFAALFGGDLLRNLPSHGGDFDFAWRLMHLDLRERALVFAERAHERAPCAVQPLVLLARLYLRFGQLDEATEACRKGLALEPGHDVLLGLYADLQTRTGAAPS